MQHLQRCHHHRHEQVRVPHYLCLNLIQKLRHIVESSIKSRIYTTNIKDYQPTPDPSSYRQHINHLQKVLGIVPVILHKKTITL